MKRQPILNFFDISSNVEELPTNELFKLKGGYSDAYDGGEIDGVDVWGDGGGNDPWGGDDGGGDDDWYNDDSDGENEYDEDYWNNIGDEGGGGGSTSGGGSSNSSQGPDYNNSEVRIKDGTITNHGDGVLFRGDDGRIIYFQGVNVAKNSFDDNSAYQLNGKIYIGEDWRNGSFDVNILAHEYGHYLQQQLYGDATYYVNVALPSVISAGFDPENHNAQWYEEDATRRGEQYLSEYSVYP